MAVHNVLLVQLPCPRCRKLSNIDINMYAGGHLRQYRYALGDTVNWDTRPDNAGARPQNGDVDVEGYAVCRTCEKDFWCAVHIRSGRFESVTIDNERQGYVP